MTDLNHVLNRTHQLNHLQDRPGRIVAKIFGRCKIVEGPLDTPCYLWQGPNSGTKRGGGYGRMNLDGATVATHKTIFVCFFGPVPPRKQVDHVCRQRLCCNPHHLEMVTHKKNQKRRDKAAKK